MNEGWTCPKCGKVYAPFWIECTSCNNKGAVITDTPAKEKSDV